MLIYRKTTINQSKSINCFTGCPFPDYNGPGCSLPCYHLCRERCEYFDVLVNLASNDSIKAIVYIILMKM